MQEQKTIGRIGYNPESVAKAIESSSRYGRKISGKEARMIHALLNFSYDPAEDCEIAYYSGLRIRVNGCDYNDENPWRDWDCNIPCVAAFGSRHGENLQEFDDAAGFSLLRPFEFISEALFRRHMGAISSVFADFNSVNGWTGATVPFLDWFAQEARENQERYGGTLTSHKMEALTSYLDDMPPSDRFSCLEGIYKAIGWPAFATSSRGYSQGDYADVLFVVTPKFREDMGNRGDYDTPAYWQERMDEASKLFDAWTWGDVFYFIIEGRSGDAWHQLTTLGNFYGDDHSASGLVDEAKGAADSLLEQRAKAGNVALTNMIRNHVPLSHRAQIMANAMDWANFG